MSTQKKRKKKIRSFGADSETSAALERQAKETDRTISYTINDIIQQHYKIGKYAIQDVAENKKGTVSS